MRHLLAIALLALSLGTIAPNTAHAQQKLSCLVTSADADPNEVGVFKCFTTVDDCLASGGGEEVECSCERDPDCDSRPDGMSVDGDPLGGGTTNGGTSSGGPGRPTRTEISNPFGGDLTTVIGRIIRVMMGISGSLALALFVYGGFLWTTSGGNADKVKQGQKLFTSAVLGLFVIFSAYILVAQVFSLLGL